MSQSIPVSSYLHCTTKDIQTFVLRKPKYMRTVDQFNEDEVVPRHLVFQFFRKMKDVKTLKAFNLKWSHINKEHMRPEIVPTIFKRHCKTLQKYDVLVLDPILPVNYKNLGVPLKNVITASVDSNKGIRKLNALKTAENLRIDLRCDKTNYKMLYQVLYRLPRLKMISVTCLPRFLNQTMAVFNMLKEAKKETIKFEILVGGQQEHSDIPPLDIKLREKVTHISFQHVSPNMLLSNLFKEKPFVFTSLKVLKLEFNNIGAKATSYLRHLRDVSQLEKLTLILRQCADIEVAGGLIRGLRFPTSLETLELDIPLYLKSSLTTTKRLTSRSVMARGRTYPWRHRNIFEEEEAFAPLFQNFAEMTRLKTIVFDFHMLESFNPHYTNFVVSALKRLQNLSFLEIQVLSHRNIHFKDTCQGFFDLAPFFQVCSSMENIEQIEILMPSLLFDDCEAKFGSTNLKSFTIGVDEKEESRPIKFSNIEKSVEKILKSLARSSPNLANLTLDFAEELTQEKLVKRFWMIQRFKNLEALGARFFVGDCNEETPREIGKVLKSLPKLNMLLLKFLETDKNIYGIQNYIKYHKSLRNMMIQFNNTAWMDNDCLIDPLKVEIKETAVDIEEEADDDDNEQNLLEQSFDDANL